MNTPTPTYQRAGYNNRLGYGASPALLLIDFAQAYFEPTSPLFGADRASVEAALTLRKAAWAANVPVILTKVTYKKGGIDGGIFFKKTPPLKCFEEGNPLGEFAEGLVPGPDDIVLTKFYPSAFFNTNLAATLTALRVDTVLIGGLTTSGCVRATCVDTVSSGFRPIIVEQAVSDISPEPHKANLFDMRAKYGDVVDLDDALTYVKSLPAKDARAG